jgi:release factor glutamine methyltransferase
VSSRTLHDRLREAQARLAASGIAEADAAIDADVLARHVLEWTREQMIVRQRDPLSAAREEAFNARFDALIARRAEREPVAYIVGNRYFGNLYFEVTRDVLIPRPETELIV